MSVTSADFKEAHGELTIGAVVLLFNLRNEELNGRVGTITTWSETSGRFGVKLNCGLCKAVRPANLATADSRIVEAYHASDEYGGMQEGASEEMSDVWARELAEQCFLVADATVPHTPPGVVPHTWA